MTAIVMLDEKKCFGSVVSAEHQTSPMLKLQSDAMVAVSFKDLQRIFVKKFRRAVSTVTAEASFSLSV
jgi:hypothetical protein